MIAYQHNNSLIYLYKEQCFIYQSFLVVYLKLFILVSLRKYFLAFYKNVKNH